jgi:hypothetical protein
MVRVIASAFRRSLLLLAVLAAALAPALRGGPEGPVPPIRSDWHLRYQPLESTEARSLLEKAMAFGRRRLGEPAITVRQVQLRRSVPRESEAAIRRNFQLTEITDSTDGVFTIYLSAQPQEVAFSGQLAHEAFHLWNARLRDAYVEGLNGLLAEELFRELGLSWDSWLRHFESGKDPLYGQSYFLARDLLCEVGREPLDRLLSFARESAGDRRRMEIDIDRWLESLDTPARLRAQAAILRRYQAIDAARRREQPEMAFRRPGSKGSQSSEGVR